MLRESSLFLEETIIAIVLIRVGREPSSLRSCDFFLHTKKPVHYPIHQPGPINAIILHLLADLRTFVATVMAKQNTREKDARLFKREEDVVHP